MPYQQKLDKTIHGRPVTQVQFRRAICEALAEMQGGGAVHDLLPFLGPEWDTPERRKLVSKTLINLARSKVIQRDVHQRGTYTVTPAFGRKGVSVADQHEQSILDSIRRRGGFARFSEIMDDHGLRAHGEDLAELRRRRLRRQAGRDTVDDDMSVYDVSGARQGLLKVLATSELIRQDFITINRYGIATTDGYYSLPLDELNKMTLRGRFAGIIAKATHQDLGLPGSYFAARDAHFSRVGDVYRTAREARGWSVLDMSLKKRVGAALRELARNPVVNRDNRDRYAGVTRVTEEQMQEDGSNQEEIRAYRDRRENERDEARGLADMLESFEAGGASLHGPNLHLNAQVSFYEALASELGIDPVAATRGYLQIDTRGDRIHVGRPQADLD